MTIAVQTTIAKHLHEHAQTRLKEILPHLETDIAEGLKQLNSLIADVPDHVPTLGNYAWACAMDGRHETAIEIYGRIAVLQPDNPEPLWRIGDRLVNLGHLDEAYAQYKRALSVWPDLLDAKMGVRY